MGGSSSPRLSFKSSSSAPAQKIKARSTYSREALLAEEPIALHRRELLVDDEPEVVEKIGRVGPMVRRVWKSDAMVFFKDIPGREANRGSLL